MSLGDWLRIIAIVGGVLILLTTWISLAKRRLTEPFCVAWAFLSIALILAGVFLRPTEIDRYVSLAGFLLIVLVSVIFLAACYFISWQVSDLVRKNRELTMQISLLNQENERILSTLEDITGKLKQDL